jgi:hypothetical protein
MMWSDFAHLTDLELHRLVHPVPCPRRMAAAVVGTATRMVARISGMAAGGITASARAGCSVGVYVWVCG